MTKEQAVTEDFKSALERFLEVLAEPKTDMARDAAIQRFEFTFDLAWKALKVVLEEKKSIMCKSPNDCIREAYRQNLIEYDADWLQALKDRNLTVHTYKEKLAEEVYARLPKALALFTKLRDTLSSAK